MIFISLCRSRLNVISFSFCLKDFNISTLSSLILNSISLYVLKKTLFCLSIWKIFWFWKNSRLTVCCFLCLFVYLLFFSVLKTYFPLSPTPLLLVRNHQPCLFNFSIHHICLSWLLLSVSYIANLSNLVMISLLIALYFMYS